MSDPSQPGISRGTPTSPAVWQCFLHSVLQSLELRPSFAPMPLDEDHAHPTVRALQRGRRHAWLHARHQLHWSMFESIRLSVRLAEAFAEWTRDGAPDMDALARRLEGVEHQARQPGPMSEELRFVDRLMSAATGTDLHLGDMEIAMEAYRSAEEPRRAARA